MKKVLLVVLISLYAMSNVKAQEASGIIKVNPIGFIFGIFNATYEKTLSPKNSVAVGANFYNWKNLGVSGFGVNGEYRFYFSNNSEAPHGMYAAPLLNVSSMSYDYVTYDENFNTIRSKESTMSFGGGVKAGHQWVWDSGIALDLYFGYGYRAASFEHYNYSGGYPILGLALGYALGQ